MLAYTYGKGTSIERANHFKVTHRVARAVVLPVLQECRRGRRSGGRDGHGVGDGPRAAWWAVGALWVQHRRAAEERAGASGQAKDVVPAAVQPGRVVTNKTA